MKNLKLIPLWAWLTLAAVGLTIGLWMGGIGNNTCGGCSCDAGCCDSGVCDVDDCACVCKAP